MASSIDDRIYHQSRAEDELRLAEGADDPAIAIVHRELAALHKRKMMAIVDHDDALPLVATPLRRGH